MVVAVVRYKVSVRCADVGKADREFGQDKNDAWSKCGFTRDRMKVRNERRRRIGGRRTRRFESDSRCR